MELIFLLKFPKTLKQQKGAVKLLIQRNMDIIPGLCSMSVQENIFSIHFHKELEKLEKICMPKANNRNQSR